MLTEQVTEYLKTELQKWEKDDTKGRIEIVRMDGGDVDIILSPRKRFRKDVPEINQSKI